MGKQHSVHAEAEPSELRVGLEGVPVARTAISYANGEKGELVYRGIWAGELAKERTFEEVAYLILYGRLPTPVDLAQLKATLVARRTLTRPIKQIVESAPREASCMAVLRAALSVIVPEGGDWPPTVAQALDILAKAPTIIAHRYNHINSRPVREPRGDLDHVENYLYMLLGDVAKPGMVRALTAYLILGMDHDLNASTFTARVVTSTQSDIVSAVCAAIGSLIGPLHGGAPSKVDDLLDDIGSEEKAESVLRQKIEHGDRLMGFGHRVYKTWDPRAAALKFVVQQLEHQDPLLRLSLLVESTAVRLLEEYKPGRNLYPNVEFWAAAVLRAVGVPRELYTPTFCCSRIAGWCAHILEQASDNRLIRPSAIYVGAHPKHPQKR
ncbi:MAG: citrate/2-methylcitrate synthase [Sulfurifustaceae bacterium]